MTMLIWLSIRTSTATWVNRYSLDGSDGGDNLNSLDEEEQTILSPLQADKMTLFFTELLDMDRDDLIGEQDFQHFCDVSDSIGR